MSLRLLILIAGIICLGSGLQHVPLQRKVAVTVKDRNKGAQIISREPLVLSLDLPPEKHLNRKVSSNNAQPVSSSWTKLRGPAGLGPKSAAVRNKRCQSQQRSRPSNAPSRPTRNNNVQHYPLLQQKGNQQSLEYNRFQQNLQSIRAYQEQLKNELRSKTSELYAEHISKLQELTSGVFDKKFDKLKSSDFSSTGIQRHISAPSINSFAVHNPNILMKQKSNNNFSVPDDHSPSYSHVTDNNKRENNLLNLTRLDPQAMKKSEVLKDTNNVNPMRQLTGQYGHLQDHIFGPNKNEPQSYGSHLLEAKTFELPSLNPPENSNIAPILMGNISSPATVTSQQDTSISTLQQSDKVSILPTREIAYNPLRNSKVLNFGPSPFSEVVKHEFGQFTKRRGINSRPFLLKTSDEHPTQTSTKNVIALLATMPLKGYMHQIPSATHLKENFSANEGVVNTINSIKPNTKNTSYFIPITPVPLLSEKLSEISQIMSYPTRLFENPAEDGGKYSSGLNNNSEHLTYHKADITNDLPELPLALIRPPSDQTADPTIFDKHAEPISKLDSIPKNWVKALHDTLAASWKDPDISESRANNESGMIIREADGTQHVKLYAPPTLANVITQDNILHDSHLLPEIELKEDAIENTVMIPSSSFGLKQERIANQGDFSINNSTHYDNNALQIAPDYSDVPNLRVEEDFNSHDMTLRGKEETKITLPSTFGRQISTEPYENALSRIEGKEEVTKELHDGVFEAIKNNSIANKRIYHQKAQFIGENALQNALQNAKSFWPGSAPNDLQPEAALSAIDSTAGSVPSLLISPIKTATEYEIIENPLKPGENYGGADFIPSKVGITNKENVIVPPYGHRLKLLKETIENALINKSLPLNITLKDNVAETSMAGNSFDMQKAVKTIKPFKATLLSENGEVLHPPEALLGTKRMSEDGKSVTGLPRTKLQDDLMTKYQQILNQLKEKNENKKDLGYTIGEKIDKDESINIALTNNGMTISTEGTLNTETLSTFEVDEPLKVQSGKNSVESGNSVNSESEKDSNEEYSNLAKSVEEYESQDNYSTADYEYDHQSQAQFPIWNNWPPIILPFLEAKKASSSHDYTTIPTKSSPSSGRSHEPIRNKITYFSPGEINLTDVNGSLLGSKSEHYIDSNKELVWGDHQIQGTPALDNDLDKASENFQDTPENEQDEHLGPNQDDIAAGIPKIKAGIKIPLPYFHSGHLPFIIPHGSYRPIPKSFETAVRLPDDFSLRDTAETHNVGFVNLETPVQQIGGCPCSKAIPFVNPEHFQVPIIRSPPFIASEKPCACSLLGKKVAKLNRRDKTKTTTEKSNKVKQEEAIRGNEEKHKHCSCCGQHSDDNFLGGNKAESGEVNKYDLISQFIHWLKDETHPDME